MGLSVRTGACGHFVDLGEGNLEPEATRILFVFFGSTNERLCRRACKNRDISYFKSHNTPIIYIYLQVRSTSSIPPSAPTSTKWHRIALSIHLCTIKYKFAFEICQPLSRAKSQKIRSPQKVIFCHKHYLSFGAEALWKTTRSAARYSHGSRAQRRS